MTIRIIKQIDRLKKQPLSNFQITPIDPNDLRQLSIIFYGQEGTPYHGGRFVLQMILPEQYPMMPPKLAFFTKIYHTNISEKGQISLEVLCHHCNRWSPAYTIKTILQLLSQLLRQPQPYDCFRIDLGNLLQKNPQQYFRIAKQQTQKYAK